MEKVVIFGMGDIAEIAHYYLLKSNEFEVVGFTVDREYLKEPTYKKLPVVPFEEVEDTFSPQECKMFVPLSYTKVNEFRAEKYNTAKEKGYKFISYISPHASIAENAIIGENCFIFEDNTVQPFVKIGNNCILWSGNHIGHHSKISDHCFIASQVVIGGGVEVEEKTFIGVNATLRDHIKIGKSNVIGAGALILSNTENNQVYMATATEVSRVPSNRLRGI